MSANFKRGLVSAAAVLASAGAWANTYTFVDLGAYVMPAGMDSQGVLAATRNVYNSRGIQRAEIYKDGQWKFEQHARGSKAVAISHGRVLGMNGAPVIWPHGGTLISVTPSDAIATGINASGDVSESTSVTYGSHCLLWSWSTGAYQDLGLLKNGDTCLTNGIDDRGHVFGEANMESHGKFYAFEWHGGLMHKLPMRDNWQSATAAAGNKNGYIVGWAGIGKREDGTYAVLWHDGVALQMSDGPLEINQALAINDSGTIVGTSWYYNGFGSSAVRWDTNGQVYLLAAETQVPHGWQELSQATAVSPAGVILGYGFHSNGTLHGFMLVPQ